MIVVTKRHARKYEFYIESWMYFFILREVGNSYMKYKPKLLPKSRSRRALIRSADLEAAEGKEKEVELTTSKNLGLSKESDKPLLSRQISKIRKFAGTGNLKIPNDFDPRRLEFRSRQAMFFHLLLTLFGIYTAVVFTSWVNISVNDIEVGTEAYDNYSVWLRFIALALGICFSMVKVFRAHYHIANMSKVEEEEFFRSNFEDSEDSH